MLTLHVRRFTYVSEHTFKVVPVVLASLAVAVHHLAFLLFCNSASLHLCISAFLHFSDLILFFQQCTKHACGCAYGFEMYVCCAFAV